MGAVNASEKLVYTERPQRDYIRDPFESSQDAVSKENRVFTFSIYVHNMLNLFLDKGYSQESAERVASLIAAIPVSELKERVKDVDEFESRLVDAKLRKRFDGIANFPFKYEDYEYRLLKDLPTLERGGVTYNRLMLGSELASYYHARGLSFRENPIPFSLLDTIKSEHRLTIPRSDLREMVELGLGYVITGQETAMALGKLYNSSSADYLPEPHYDKDFYTKVLKLIAVMEDPDCEVIFSSINDMSYRLVSPYMDKLEEVKAPSRGYSKEGLQGSLVYFKVSPSFHLTDFSLESLQGYFSPKQQQSKLSLVSENVQSQEQVQEQDEDFEDASQSTTSLATQSLEASDALAEKVQKALSNTKIQESNNKEESNDSIIKSNKASTSDSTKSAVPYNVVMANEQSPYAGLRRKINSGNPLPQGNDYERRYQASRPISRLLGGSHLGRGKRKHKEDGSLVTYKLKNHGKKKTSNEVNVSNAEVNDQTAKTAQAPNSPEVTQDETKVTKAVDSTASQAQPVTSVSTDVTQGDSVQKLTAIHDKLKELVDFKENAEGIIADLNAQINDLKDQNQELINAQALLKSDLKAEVIKNQKLVTENKTLVTQKALLDKTVTTLQSTVKDFERQTSNLEQLLSSLGL